jgi:hypothetical protein
MSRPDEVLDEKPIVSRYMSWSNKEPVASRYISRFDEVLGVELVASCYMSRSNATFDKET